MALPAPTPYMSSGFKTGSNSVCGKPKRGQQPAAHNLQNAPYNSSLGAASLESLNSQREDIL
ncbi:hypothetical protein F443_19323 [Phytophthora nicotianae P1569]|uniref:Uncharacterized protein n=2 Tax=Phytophthora nicotianae TaxID=4792 RepID=V9E6F0_PHYNI|nr:hypothetical protein F443_19323 [Phytophthora nicotianae P1569]